MVSSPPGSALKPRAFRRLLRTLSITALLLASLVVSLATVHGATKAASGLVLEYADGTTTATTSTPHPHFEIVNTTTSSVSLSSLTIRYWYTADGTQSQQFWCDYAVVGCSNLTGSFVSLASPTSTADTYLQVGFASGAGSLAANGNTGDLQTRFNKSVPQYTHYSEE